jgi:hypothetical protein
MVDANNRTFTDFTMHNTTETGVFYITQFTIFSGVVGDCNTSLFNIGNIHFTNIRGTVGTSYVASMQCSKASPCTGIEIKDNRGTRRYARSLPPIISFATGVFNAGSAKHFAFCRLPFAVCRIA